MEITEIEFRLVVRQIDLVFGAVCRIKTYDKRLPRFNRRDELDRRYADNLGSMPPLTQNGCDFLKNDDAGHDWVPGKMTSQAGMIGGNYAASFESHLIRISRHSEHSRGTP